MNNIILKNCQHLLENYPELRELRNVRQAVWKYWLEFHGIREMTYERWVSSDLPQPETITRLFRKVKSEHPHLRGTDESRHDQVNQERFIQEQLGYRT